jgi:transposase-like protein
MKAIWRTTKLTASELRRIKSLREQRCSVTQIARILSITRNTVDRALRKMGLPSKPAIPEQEILQLLRNNLDRRIVAERLHVSLRAVKRVGKKFGTKKKPDPFRGKGPKIEALLRSRLYTAREIANLEKVPYRPVLNKAHENEFYGPVKFIGSWATPEKPPFSSYEPLPQKVYRRCFTDDGSDNEDIYLKLAARIFPERITFSSERDVAIIGRFMRATMARHPWFAAAPTNELAAFHLGLVGALSTLRMAQSGPVH